MSERINRGGAGGIKRAGCRNPTVSMYAVATGSDGKPLDRNGMARLVVPADAKGSRSVANLAGIEVFTLPPQR